jgi:hypothetical protein
MCYSRILVACVRNCLLLFLFPSEYIPWLYRVWDIYFMCSLSRACNLNYSLVSLFLFSCLHRFVQRYFIFFCSLWKGFCGSDVGSQISTTILCRYRYVFNVTNNRRLREHNAKSLVEKSSEFFMLAVAQKSMLQPSWEKNCKKVDAE